MFRGERCGTTTIWVIRRQQFNYVLLFSTVFQVAILEKINHGCTNIKCNFV